MVDKFQLFGNICHMNRKTVNFVIATQKSKEEYLETKEGIILSEIKGIEITVVENNTDGLSTVYNGYFDKEFRDQIVCFIHDDVTVYDIDVVNKLNEAHRDTPIVGLAGATEIRLPFEIRYPTAWHILSTFEKERKQSGFVAHTKNGEYWSTQFGIAPQKCKMIDGLFMSFDMGRCLDAGLKFNEKFKFHHYDLAMCMEAYKLNIDITTYPIYIEHSSMGEMDSSWNDSHKLFVEEYKEIK